MFGEFMYLTYDIEKSDNGDDGDFPFLNEKLFRNPQNAR